MKKGFGEKLFSVCNYIFLVLISFAFLFPFWRVVVLSVNDGLDASMGGIYFWPRLFTLDNYIVIFSRNDITNAYFITIGRTVIGTILSILLMSMMAYGLSKNVVRGRKIINIMLIITMFFSGGLIPTYLLYRSLGLLDSFWVYVFPCLYGAGSIFIFRSFFRALPMELEESAKIDGANDLKVFMKIVFPLSAPIIATMSLFIAVGHWNDYMSGVLYISNRNLAPLQTLLYWIISEADSAKMVLQGSGNLNDMQNSHITSQAIRMATLVTVILPIMCIYPLLQKHFVKGIMIGSLKG